MSHDTERTAIEAAFYLQYGKTVAAWASLEFALSLWFHRITCMPPMGIGISRALYFSGKGFSARHNLLTAALKKLNPTLKLFGLESSPDEDTIRFLREALKTARLYSETRNEIIHGHAMFDTTSCRMGLVEGDSWYEEGIGIGELKVVETNYHALTQLLLRVLKSAQERSSLTSKEALELVRAMPKRASSDQPRPKPAADRQRRVRG